MLSFENTEIAFKAKSDKDLNRAYFLFSMVKHPWMVSIGKFATQLALQLRLPVRGLIRKTVFDHFCGGESIEDCTKTIEELHQFGIGTILDYSVEGKAKEADFDNCLNHTLATIDMAVQHPEAIPFCVFKPSGLGRFKLWEDLSSDQAEKIKESAEYRRVYHRVDSICKAAHKAGVPILIDAEESWIQKGVDDMSDLMMVKYNKERLIIYNTIQLYRHDRLAYLKSSVANAKNGGYFYGAKAVRGAYMEKERARAKEKGYPSPIQESKLHCDNDYNEALAWCLDHLEVVGLCAGTHNERSTQLLFEGMKKRNIALNDPRVYFAQLYGMSDHISFNLSREGCNVAKYVPYGPVKDVMPYLFRRAEENTSVAGQTGRELTLLQKEKNRRKLAQ